MLRWSVSNGLPCIHVFPSNTYLRSTHACTP